MVKKKRNKNLNEALHQRKSGRHALKKGKRASRALTKFRLKDVPTTADN